MSNGRYSNDYLQLFFMCKEFHCLPYAGGYLEQPAIYMEAFELIQETINQYEAQKRKKGGY